MLIALEGYSGVGRTFGLDDLGLERQTVDVKLMAEAKPAAVGQSLGLDMLSIDKASWGGLDVMQLRPDDALAEYLGRAGLGPVVKRFTKTSAVEVVATAAPGIRDLVTLGKIRQMEEAGAADLIIVDAPASGHALSFLTSPAAMADSADSGPIRDQADQVLTMLADERRCQVLLVTLPEETPVTETVETAYAIEDRVGVQLGPLVVNGVWTEIAGLAARVDDNPGGAHRAGYFRLQRHDSQQAQLDRLSAELPLPTMQTPFLFQPGLDLSGVITLAAALDHQAAGLNTEGANRRSPDFTVSASNQIHQVEQAGTLLDTVDAGPPRGELPTDPVVLCLGPGGVGKTTVSAAVAMAIAKRGKRVVVLTIDPARRLADALGLKSPESEAGGLGNDATLVGHFGSGELWATMLDPAETFEQVVRSEASSAEQAERILGNRLFKNLAYSLSGTNEYMAVERLHQLHLDDRFDVVVVDTPPSRHAVDFLDSPGRLTRFVDHRLYRSVFAPGNAVLRGVSAGGQLMLRVLGKMVGAGLVTDVVSFFSEFQGLDEGFRRRADELRAVLDDKSAAMAVVSPRRGPLTELTWIAARVAERLRPLDLVVVNRATPLSEVESVESSAPGDDDGQDPLVLNLRQLNGLARMERQLVSESLGTESPGSESESDSKSESESTPIIWLEERAVPVRDLDGLAELAADLER